MKIGILNFLTLFSLMFIVSCVQGPVDLSSITLQDFPQLSSSSPVGTSITMTDEDIATIFSISITNNSTEGFHTQWTLNSIVQQVANDQLTFSFDPSASNIGVGAHALVVTVYSGDGSKILGSRTWYVTVNNAIQVTGRNPATSAIITMTDQKNITDGAFGVKVNGALSANAFGVVVNRSLINGESLASVKFFHKDNLSSSCTDETNVACAMTIIGSEQILVANTYTYLTSVAPTFNIDIAPDDGPSQIHQIIAKIYHKEPNPSTVKTEVGAPIIWSVEVMPLNQRPSISFIGDSTSSVQALTVPQDSAINLTFSASDLETTSTNLVAQYEFSQDAGTTWQAVNGATFIEGHVTPSCNGAGITNCSITFPSHSLAAGNPSPLAPKTYYVRAQVIDGGQNSGVSLSSRVITWEVTTTERQILATVSTPATVLATEGLNAQITYTVTDSQYDDYCIQVVRFGDGQLQKIVSDDTAVAAVNSTEYCPASNLLYPLEAGDTRTISFFIPYDTVSVNGAVAYTLRVKEVLSVATATSTTRSINFSVNVTNDNPAPVLGGVAVPLVNAATFDVVTGAEFTIYPGDFSDPSYISGATNIENKLFYTWQVAQDALDCSSAAYSDIPGVTELGPIELDNNSTAYPQTTLTWTPPASSAGNRMCFRLCYRDDGETGCAHNQVWAGSLGTGIVLARSNAVNHTAQIADINVIDTFTDTSVIPALTYSVVSETAAAANYKLSLTTHTENANSGTAVLLASYTPTLSTKIIDLSMTRDPVTGYLYIATLVNDGINADHYLVYVTAHDSAGAFIPGSEFKLTSYARSMGQISWDGTNWFLPYIESTGRQVVIAAGTSAAIVAETIINYYGTTNKSVTSIRSAVPTQTLLLALERDDNSLSLYGLSLADTIFDLTDISTFKEDIFGTNSLKSIRLATTTSNVDLDNDIYVMAINNSATGKLALARFDLDGSTEAIMNSITSSAGAVQNMDRIKVNATSDALVLGILNSNNNLYIAKLSIDDALNDVWALTSAEISYQVNPSAESALRDNFSMTPIISNYAMSSRSNGANYTADSLFMFYGTGTEVHTALVNLETTSISASSESGIGDHPGFFK